MIGRRIVLAGLVLVTACSTSRAGGEPPPTSPVDSDAAEEPSSATTPPASDTPPPAATAPSPTPPGEPTTSAPPSTTVPATRPPRSTTTTSPIPPLRGVDWNAFDLALADEIVGGGSRAASVAVAVDGKIVHRGAYGQRVPGEPLETSDRFRIASLSKPLAATAALRLVDRGELALDDPVLPIVAAELGVPIVDPRASRVTLRQLLGHTSGFGEFENEMFYAGSTSCPHAASIALAEPLNNPTGTRYRYSNMNYCVLGILLEALNGATYEQVIARDVLRPLGIKDMRTAGTRDVGRSDVLHDVAPDRTYMETLGAAGTWIATPSDVVTFADSLDPAKRAEHPLSDELSKAMRTPSAPRLPGQARRTVWYGLGLMNWRDGAFGHTGTLENTHAMMLVRPDGVTWAVLVSGENPWTSSDLGAMVDKALLVALR